MLKTALACVVLALGSGCVGNVDPQSGEPVDEITETSDDAVDEAVLSNPLYKAAANSPLIGLGISGGAVVAAQE